VTRTLQRLRPLLIGLVVLLFTAGIVLASKPSTPPAGLSVAREAAGKIVPDQGDGDDQDDEAEQAEQAEQAEPGEEAAVEALPAGGTDEDGGENCAIDPTGLTDEALGQLKHGSVVCWAAHQETPDGYDNHGQWVSERARKNHGHADETVDEDPAAVSAGSPNGHAGKGKANQP
jgi:hypothetical protein